MAVRKLWMALVFLLSGCGGGEPVGPGTPPGGGRSNVQLTVLSSSGAPFSSASVRFPSSAGAAGATLSGMLGSTAVRLALTDSVTGTFLVPAVPARTYELTVDFGASFRGTTSMTVLVAPTIADPRGEVTTPVNEFAERVDSLITRLTALPTDSTGVTSGQIAYLQGRSQALRTQLATATDAELLEIALWLRANPELFDDAVPPPGLGPQAVSAAEIRSWVESFMNRFTAGKIRLVATIGGCTAGLAATGPLAVFAGVACGAAIAYQSVQLGNQVTHELGRIYAIPERLIVSFSGGNASGSQAVSGVSRAAFRVEPGEPKTVNFSGSFRSVTSNDRGALGALFQIADELTSVVSSVAAFIPGFDPPAFTPPSGARSQTFAVAGGDVSFSLPGCSVSPTAQGATVTCGQVSVSDLSVNGAFTYRNDYGSVVEAVGITVGRTWATVGGIGYVVNSTIPQTTLNGVNAIACRITMTIPVSGNTPVRFTGWRGIWSPGGHTEGGSTSSIVDPKVHSGIIWTDNLPFYYTYGEGNRPSSFSVAYNVTYAIPALGTSGSVSTTLTCRP